MQLCDLGHLASARTLRAAGFTRTQVERAIETGTVTRIRRGTYACAHLDSGIVVAAREGGALTCISVLREAAVWAGNDQQPHVQVNPGSSGTRRAGIQLHYERARFGMETPWRVSRMQALWQAMRCLDNENAVAAMESAIHNRFLSEGEVRRLSALAPRRLSWGIQNLITASESGNETIVRLRLLQAGYDVVAQGQVPGLGRQDLVVNDCVGIEVDSREWHGDDQLAADRRRDLIAEGLGRRVLRLNPDHIHKSWSRTLAVIDRVVADARRIRRPPRRSGATLDEDELQLAAASVPLTRRVAKSPPLAPKSPLDGGLS